jgi:hypothetical protein
MRRLNHLSKTLLNGVLFQQRLCLKNMKKNAYRSEKARQTFTTCE